MADVMDVLMGLYGFLVLLVKVLYYCLEAMVLSVIPASVRGKKIAGETVLITGAGSGIGRLLAKRFASHGCRLVLWDIDEKGNQQTAADVKTFGVAVKAYTVDLSDKEKIYETAAKVKKDMGYIDILVNNAGIVTGKRFLDSPDHMIQKTMQVNVEAHFWTVKCFLPKMMERNHGHIVNVASTAGTLGVSGMVDYCASKFAAVGFDESLRFEMMKLGKTGIHTTVICPYLINTGMFAGCKTRYSFLMPEQNPDDVADCIMNGVLCNNAMVYIPKSINFFMAPKGILPAKVQFLLCDFLGVFNMMDTFQGRQKKSS